MQLLLIRHAQSSNNRLEGHPEYLQGRLADPPLTRLGHQQAQWLAEWAAGDEVGRRVTHLYTSLMTRAVQTAAPLASALGLEVHGLTEAYECGGLTTGPAGGFTPVAGRPHASLLQDCPALRWPETLQGQPWDGGAEPWDAARFAARAAQVVAKLQATADRAEVVALVTHHDFAQYLLADLLGLPHDVTRTFRLQNTGTALLELGPDDGRLRTPLWFNRTGHLPPEALTG
ncbi:histidine phosphatase family protein [Deinococcus sonorensis]|uniref:Histidine phosphatase family protein n=2 Tax=Deinococcus sonorensis TaxID=309891 RepID=A0AAU7U833_9DEIO